MKRIAVALYSALTMVSAAAQFAPAAGQPGSTALRHDSSCFVAWATGCNVQRGLMDMSEPDSGCASVGSGSSAIGPALLNGVVSLGDGGTATLSFGSPIINGAGWDFAVFENTFLDSFLELAFVEVSSDGSRFVRFRASSLTDTAIQTGPFGYTRPENVNNLAGKYVVGFGTPFDLEELKDSAGLDVMNITQVRVVDVVGSIQATYATRDAAGRKINDPWPTRFASSGFDLDAVGVIHQKNGMGSTQSDARPTFSCHPNPVSGHLLYVHSDKQTRLLLYNALGAKIDAFSVQKGENQLRLAIPTGTYHLLDPASGFRLRLMVVN